MTTPDANGWMPIESAPKDGSKFVAHLSNGWIVHLWGHDGIREERCRYQWWGGSERLSIPYEPSHPADTDWAKTSTLRATHWQPLPKPPVSEARK